MRKPKPAPTTTLTVDHLPQGYAIRQQGAFYYAVVYENGHDASNGWRELQDPGVYKDAKHPEFGLADVPAMEKKPELLLRLVQLHQSQHAPAPVTRLEGRQWVRSDQPRTKTA